MIASVISAATFTPMSAIENSKPKLPSFNTFSRRARARCPVRNRMRSAMRKFLFAPPDRRPQRVERLDHVCRLERFQPLGVVEVDAARIDLDHAFRRLDL